MIHGFQIAGLFLTITAALAFTAWAETWLASAATPVIRRTSNAKGSARAAFVDQPQQIVDALKKGN